MPDYAVILNAVPILHMDRKNALMVSRLESNLVLLRYVRKGMEAIRIIIGPNDKSAFVVKDNQWAPTPISESLVDQLSVREIIGLSDDAFDGTMLDFMKPYLVDSNRTVKEKGLLLQVALKEPLFEQFSRIPVFRPFCTYVLNEPMENWKDFYWYVAQFFGNGYYSATENSVFRKLRLNRHQVIKIMGELSSGHKDPLVFSPRVLRRCLGRRDLAPVPNDLFDELFEYLTWRAGLPQAEECVEDILLPLADMGVDVLLKWVKGPGHCYGITFYRNGRTYTNLEYILRDTLRMCRTIGMDGPIRVSSVQDIICDHDRLMQRQAEIEMENRRAAWQSYLEKREALFDKRKPVWKRWTYADPNAEFIVVAPTSTDDIAQEGQLLHHCVASYIDDVATGATNILFLRRKSRPEEPFYTIEIKAGLVRQIHGVYNSAIDEEAGLPQFVCQWAKAVGVRCAGA